MGLPRCESLKNLSGFRGAWDTDYREYRGEYFIFAGVGVPRPYRP